MDDHLGNDYRDEQKVGKVYNNPKTEKSTMVRNELQGYVHWGD